MKWQLGILFEEDPMKPAQVLAAKIRMHTQRLSEKIGPDPIERLLKELLKPQGQLTHKDRQAKE